MESEKELSRGSQEEVGGNQGGSWLLGARQESSAGEGERGASAEFINVWVAEDPRPGLFCGGRGRPDQSRQRRER